ncbi:hypothetical protein AVEN_125949-1 [Araneus ventricosus]|uniref:Uncharacterized protein n=1 Tax=Araneus ventricosus TaxID=182803 RepID=A0A4Y2RTD8_ARAVE|nr:hypothetical protein AVEN_125949-1 [Araneus ventricosus]
MALVSIVYRRSNRRFISSFGLAKQNQRRSNRRFISSVFGLRKKPTSFYLDLWSCETNQRQIFLSRLWSSMKQNQRRFISSFGLAKQNQSSFSRFYLVFWSCRNIKTNVESCSNKPSVTRVLSRLFGLAEQRNKTNVVQTVVLSRLLVLRNKTNVVHTSRTASSSLLF